ncbi:MAG: NTP transferase domain-containing protein [Candidatus Promineifilaceae bacterium]|nr:NTP transferase domain-containing protein [Candidatus Promineifilaceae bacterium]
MSLAIVILAAGQGTRMKSKMQKILHDVGGKPMVQHAFEAATAISNQAPVLVIGPGETGVRELFGAKARYVVQPEQLGTGHATQMAQALLQGHAEQVIVTYGDMPLLRAESLRRLQETQLTTGAAITMLSAIGDPQSSFGRIVRNKNNDVVEIVEVAEARQRPNTAELLAIRELNAGVYCFSAPFLWENIDHLPLHKARSGHEYYLTDMVSIAVNKGLRVTAEIVADAEECLGAGTRQELVAVEKAFRHRANQYWLDNGVTIIDPDTTFIDQDVQIGQDTVIWPNTFLQGTSSIGEDCVIGPNSIIRNSTVGAACRIESALVEDARVAEATRVTPFTIVSGQ